MHNLLGAKFVINDSQICFSHETEIKNEGTACLFINSIYIIGSQTVYSSRKLD